MTKFWRLLLLALLVNGLLVTVALARTVYMNDGSRVEAISVWEDEGMIRVLVNRDSLISFYPHEIDLKKTFAKKPRKPVRKALPAVAAPPVPAAAPAAQTPPAATTKPPAPSATAAPAPAQPAATAAQKPAAPAPAPAAVASTPTATPAAKPAPAAAPATAPKAAAPTPAQSAAVATPAAPAAPQAAAPAPAKPPVAATPAAPPVPPAVKVAPPKVAPAPVAVEPIPFEDPTIVLVVAAGLVVFVLLLLASIWIVFVKAGEAGWKSLIPIYNVIVLLRIAGCPAWWFLMFFIPLVNLWFLVVMHIRLAEKFGKGPVFGFGLFLFGFLFYPLLAFGPAVYERPRLGEFSFDEVEDDQS